ncbi:MAG: hypothetical protein ABSB10_07330 [Candidatus Bathyarchaeia archaeon]|jgi:hypothetical protein
MIPQFPIALRINVEIDRISSVPWTIIHEKSGLFSNHFYEYMRGIGWNAFKRVCEIEEKAVNYIDSMTTTIEEFEELAEKLFNEPKWNELKYLAGLDLGIANVVFALYAFGCFPITSCRGHPPPRGERHPLVVFFPRPELTSIIVGVAAGAGVGMLNVETDNKEGLIVFGRSIVDMEKFANGLHNVFPAASMMKPKKKTLKTNYALPENPKSLTTQANLDLWLSMI